MRKRIKGLAVMLIALPVFLTSCGNENNIVTEEPSTTINNENDDIKYNIYKSGVESGAINGLSYEEWISSIKGKDGVTPTISIDADGYWVINGENTNIKAKSKVSIGEDNYWYIDGVSTGIKAKVDDGNKWYFGTTKDEESSTQKYNIGDLFLDTNSLKVYRYSFIYSSYPEKTYYWEFITDLSLKIDKETVTVSFDTNIPDFMYEYIEKYETLPDKTINKGEWLDLDTFSKEKELNKYFLGWYAGEGVDETKITSYTSITRDCLLKAKWDYEKIDNEYNTPGVTFREGVSFIHKREGKTYMADFPKSNIASNVKKVHIAKTYKGSPVTGVNMLNYLPENVEYVSVPANTGVFGGLAGLTEEEQECNYSLKQFVWRDPSDIEVEIWSRAFSHCCGLEEIKLPSTVTELGGLAFYDCKSLKNITLDPNIKTIGREAFAYCTSLENVYFTGVESIEEKAFYGCTNLWASFNPINLRFTIPASVKYIGNEAFYGCTSLTSIQIRSSEILNLTDNDSCLFTYVKTIENYNESAVTSPLDIASDAYIKTSGLFYTSKNEDSYFFIDNPHYIYRKQSEEDNNN